MNIPLPEWRTLAFFNVAVWINIWLVKATFGEVAALEWAGWVWEGLKGMGG